MIRGRCGVDHKGVATKVDTWSAGAVFPNHCTSQEIRYLFAPAPNLSGIWLERHANLMETFITHCDPRDYYYLNATFPSAISNSSHLRNEYIRVFLIRTSLIRAKSKAQTGSWRWSYLDFPYLLDLNRSLALK